MKRLALISFTERGARLCKSLEQALTLQGYCCEAYGGERYAKENELLPLKTSLRDWTGEMFERMEGLLFIGASGIAVRAIAPHLSGKDKDPAVAVMDEKGMFAISLLSGHLGGANELAGTLSNLTGAIPVITTATDVNGKFAVDVFAKKQNLYISSLPMAKAVSAAVLDEEPVGLVTDFPILGKIPAELSLMEENTPFEGTCGIRIALNEQSRPFRQTLHLIPRIVAVGIGCRKGVKKEEIAQAVTQALESHHISPHALLQIATIDLKAKEPGLLEFAKELGIKLATYSAGELKRVEGAFTPSAFVREVTGVDNVCERAAVLASAGKLIQKKKGGNGITVALAVKDWSVDFE